MDNSFEWSTNNSHTLGTGCIAEQKLILVGDGSFVLSHRLGTEPHNFLLFEMSKDLRLVPRAGSVVRTKILPSCQMGSSTFNSRFSTLLAFHAKKGAGLLVHLKTGRKVVGNVRTFLCKEKAEFLLVHLRSRLETLRFLFAGEADGDFDGSTPSACFGRAGVAAGATDAGASTTLELYHTGGSFGMLWSATCSSIFLKKRAMCSTHSRGISDFRLDPSSPPSRIWTLSVFDAKTIILPKTCSKFFWLMVSMIFDASW